MEIRPYNPSITTCIFDSNGFELNRVTAEPTSSEYWKNVLKDAINQKEKEERREENKMADTRKILNIYEDIETLKIRKKYDEKCENVESESTESKIAKKVREYAQKELKKAFLNYDESIITVTFKFTDETRTKIEEVHKEGRKEQEKLDEKIQEINAILEMAETFEQKMQILLAYDVIDNKGVMKK